LRDRPFLLFLATTSLIQSSHMIYYGFATLYWQAAGLSGGIIGALWAEGVIAEVIMFALGAKVLRRFGPGRMMVLAGLAGVLRWTVLASTTNPWLLASVQCLHSFTFCAAHLGAMHFISHAVPRTLAARAQGYYTSISTGVVSGITMLGAGALYHSLNGSSFLAMTLISAAGTGAAILLLPHWPGRAVPPSSEST
jgi:PPP family 3-phenylpropionic acid transporter